MCFEPLELRAHRMYREAVESTGQQPVKFESRDIPQADSLANVRTVVAALSRGSFGASAISSETNISSRHVSYAMHAARALGWVDAASRVTTAGALLLETQIESLEERAHFRSAVLTSAVMRAIAPDLLHARGPTREELVDRIERTTPGLARATAIRRAQTLLAWRLLLL